MAATPEHSESSIPEVPRPKGNIFRPLYADGITWEGQVFIVGMGDKLPARLILTRNRIVLVVNGEVALEVPRRWLVPEARQVGDLAVQIFMTPENETDADDLALEVRGTNADAAKLYTALTGRQAKSTQQPDPRVWDGRVGAAPAISLPPLPEFNQQESAPKPNTARAWPPTGSEAVPAPARRQTARPAPAGESIAAWTARNLDHRPLPEPTPVPKSVSREARKRATLSDGRTVADVEVPQVQLAPPVPASWPARVLRVALLLILLGTGWYFAGDRLQHEYSLQSLYDQAQDRFQDDDQDDPGLAALVAEPTPTPTGPASDGTGGAASDDLAEIPATEEPTVAPTDEPATDEPTVAPTEEPANEEPTVAPTDEPATDEPTVAPTEEPVTEEPTVAPTDEPVTEEPTVAPTDEPVTEEPTVAPTEESATEEPSVAPTEEPVTEEPTVAPTEEPVTEEPTVAPTEEPVTEEPTVAPTEEPATEEPTTAPTATLVPQEPSVDPDNPPAQESAAGGFRVAVDGIVAGDDVAAVLPDLQPVTYGTWVVVTITATNASSTEQVFDMTTFQLLADGELMTLDTGNSWVNSLLGYTPAYGNTDAILWASGESHRVALTFLVPNGAQSLVLQVGDQVIDLGVSLDSGFSVPDASQESTQPEVLEGTVVEVLDGETIVVDINGVLQTVKYIGISAPTGDSCYSAESTTLNSNLVAGKTVRMERQSTNTDARGNWVRDVWVEGEDGTWLLVSQALVSQGAAEASISEPNTRFAGWLSGTQAAAQSSELGIWSGCQ